MHAMVSSRLALISSRSSDPTPAPAYLFFFLAASHQSSVLQTAVGAHEDNRDSLHASASVLLLVKG